MLKEKVLKTPKMENKELVSVIIPTYNRAHIIKRAIKSVLNQTHENLEIIVIDDASTDNTHEIVGSIRDNRVSYIRHETNKNGSAARNTGMKKARGNYIAFLDSDDIWNEKKTEQQLDRIKSAGNEYGAVYCSYINYYEDKGVKEFSNKAANLEGNVRKALLGGWCPSTTSLFMIRVEARDAGLFFDENLKSFQDHDYWIRVSEKFKFCAVNNYLVTKYEHAGIQVAKNLVPRIESINTFLDKWHNEIHEYAGKKAFAKFRGDKIYSVCRATLVEKKQSLNREDVNLVFKNIMAIPWYSNLRYFKMFLRSFILKLVYLNNP